VPESETDSSTFSPLGDRAPDWAQEIAASYVSGASSVFLLHGNIHDLVPVGDIEKDTADFVSLEHYLATQLFGRRDIVLQYDRGSGITFQAPLDSDRRKTMRKDFQRTLEAIDLVSGTSFARSRPKDPKLVFELLDRYILHKLAEAPSEKGGRRRSLAILIRYLETIVPAVDASWLTGELGSNLLKVLNWANDPVIRKADITFCLLAETLADLNPRLVENPFISKVEIPLPDESVRHDYGTTILAEHALEHVDPDSLAKESNGLTLGGLSQAMSRTVGARRQTDGLEIEILRRAKKELIEKQCFGLVEFLIPGFGLDMVVAQPAVKERLVDDARMFRNGKLEALPMGYLLCGVIGTGKTFTATCFAGTLGIPAIVFKNLRSKWVGSSEGNMQKVLSVVKALGPVVVIIDEADAALGSRAAAGDSGTSRRMFAMISSLMSDTRYRGRILWMLLTCRPDLLPVDLKRQGRCEVHIPLFPPETEEERKDMFLAMAKKNGVEIDSDDVPTLPENLSGADIESLVVQIVRRAALDGVEVPGAKHISETIEHFVTPAYGLEKELQRLVAIRESTDLTFLPERYRPHLTDDEKILALERRIREIGETLRETQ